MRGQGNASCRRSLSRAPPQCAASPGLRGTDTGCSLVWGRLGCLCSPTFRRAPWEAVATAREAAEPLEYPCHPKHCTGLEALTGSHGQARGSRGRSVGTSGWMGDQHSPLPATQRWIPLRSVGLMPRDVWLELGCRSFSAPLPTSCRSLCHWQPRVLTSGVSRVGVTRGGRSAPHPSP